MSSLEEYSSQVAMLAGRLRTVCERSIQHRNQTAQMRYTNIVTFTTGALYGLQRALVAGFDPRDDGEERTPPEIEKFCREEVQHRAELLGLIEKGRVPCSSDWGGYYFNTALYRINAAIDLIGAHFGGRKQLVAAEVAFSTVIKDRDRMAHEPAGIFLRTAFYEEVVAAVARLIDLLEILADRLEPR